MADRSDYQEAGGTRPGRARRLIAGLRVSPHDEELLAVVRPYLAEADSAGEVAYRLWRRGLEVTLAEVSGVGAPLPPEMTEQRLASLVAQRLLLCLPLLRRTGILGLLELDAAPRAPQVIPEPQGLIGGVPVETIDTGASDAIAALGGNDFL